MALSFATSGSPAYSVLACLVISFMYVGSLYLWRSRYGRDHPKTVKQRFLSVTIVCLLAPFIVWAGGKDSTSSDAHGLMEWLGVRYTGLLHSIVWPSLLTIILFLGPLTLHYIDGVFSLYADPMYWKRNFKNIIWIRNHIVAPLTEEFIYRACMLPLLVASFGPTYSVFVCPLFFGVAHAHHMFDKITKDQIEMKTALLQTAFQFLYTTLFGMYSAFLFLRTGHLMAPVVVHAFCNHMGFPDFNEVFAHDKAAVRLIILLSFLGGLALWMFLLFPLTEPWYYGNNIYNLV